MLCIPTRELLLFCMFHSNCQKIGSPNSVRCQASKCLWQYLETNDLSEHHHASGIAESNRSYSDHRRHMLAFDCGVVARSRHFVRRTVDTRIEYLSCPAHLDSTEPHWDKLHRTDNFLPSTALQDSNFQKRWHHKTSRRGHHCCLLLHCWWWCWLHPRPVAERCVDPPRPQNSLAETKLVAAEAVWTTLRPSCSFLQ